LNLNNTTTKHLEATMSKANLLFRNAEQIETLVNFYNEQKISFKVKHSQYSTVIDFGKEKIKFVTSTYNPRVFVVNKTLVKEIKESPDTLDLLHRRYNTDNYDVRNGLQTKNYGRVINIDIISAYITVLKNNGLCSEATFQKLFALPKKERLVAVGMIAKRATVFSYENGECIDWDVEVGEYANIFYFVIFEIDRIMRFCKEVAGEFYIMHWVDGLFLEPHTPKSVLMEIQKIIRKERYKFRFEQIDQFKVSREDDMISIDMVKNNEVKNFRFADKRMQENYNAILNVLHHDTLQLQRNVIPDIQLSEGDQINDFETFFT